jgi:hypothetical protein
MLKSATVKRSRHKAKGVRRKAKAAGQAPQHAQNAITEAQDAESHHEGASSAHQMERWRFTLLQDQGRLPVLYQRRQGGSSDPLGQALWWTQTLHVDRCDQLIEAAQEGQEVLMYA